VKKRLLLGAVAFGVSAAAAMPGTPASADKIRNDQWHLSALKVTQAHRLTTGEGVTVAVVDSGVEPHRDLRGRLLPSTTIVPDQSGNRRRTDDSHGTQMAGVIAAVGHGSGDGALGVAPGAKILPIEIQGLDKYASPTDVGRSIKSAIEGGADVVNVSLATAPDDVMDAAIKLAAERDVLVVASIGNTNKDIYGGYPALIPGVLAVGGSDQNGDHADVSIRDKAIEVCAPSDDIVSTGLRNRYSIGTGTSDSTAIVSGAAALVRSKFPDLSAQEVAHRLTATADDNGPPGRDDECGYGVLNIVKALTADVPPLDPTAAPTTPPAGNPTPPDNATPSAEAAPDTEPASSAAPLVGGAVIGVLTLGGLLAFLVTRRRNSGDPYR
jgi:type VII secretion-associated serine protease mycosin